MKDPRRARKGNFKDELVEMIFLVISAVVSGCNDSEMIAVFGETQQEWLRKYFPYKNGLPSHDTINRLFSAMDSKAFGGFFIKCGKTEKEVRFSISSHKADAGKINDIVRKHWSIENSLHWMLDVVFSEDKSRKTAGNSAANFNTISNIALERLLFSK